MANNNLSNVKRYSNSSTKDGAHHWWMQRFTAIALIILVTWFVIFFIKFGTHPVIHIMSFLAQPFNTMLVISLMVSAIYHANIGMKVIIEDYIHCEFYKKSSSNKTQYRIMVYSDLWRDSHDVLPYFLLCCE